jgi:hypothetical protein
MKHPNHNIANEYRAIWKDKIEERIELYFKKYANKCLHTEIIYFADNYHCSECGYKITQWGDL